MKVFYWTEPMADYARAFYQVNTDDNFTAQVPTNHVGPDMIKAMLEDGFVEISSSTAYKMGLPS